MQPDLVVNLADPGVHRRYLAHPELLLGILEGAPASTRLVFIDEVQKVRRYWTHFRSFWIPHRSASAFCCPDRALPDERGLLLEHFIAQELYRRTGTLWPEARLFHYRTKHGAEVDFVLEVGRDLWGIEVKSTRTASADMLTGLQSLAARTKRLKRKILVCMTDRRARLGDVEALPIRQFLAELPP